MDIIHVLLILLLACIIQIQMSQGQTNKTLYQRRKYRLIIDEPYEQNPIFIHPNVPRCVILKENPMLDLPWNETLRHEAPWPPPEPIHDLFSQLYKKYTRIFPDQRSIEIRRLIPWNQLSVNFWEARYLVTLIFGIGTFLALSLTIPLILILVWGFGKYVSPCIFWTVGLIVNNKTRNAIRYLFIQRETFLNRLAILTAPKGHKFYGKFKHSKFFQQLNEEEEILPSNIPEEEEETKDTSYFEPPEITNLKDRIQEIQGMKDQEAAGKQIKNLLYDIPENRKLALRLGIPYDEDKDREKVVFGKRKIQVIRQDQFTVPGRLREEYKERASLSSSTSQQSDAFDEDEEVPEEPSEEELNPQRDPVLDEAKKMIRKPGQTKKKKGAPGTATRPSSPAGGLKRHSIVYKEKKRKKPKPSPFAVIPKGLEAHFKKRNPFAALEQSSNTETEEADTEEEIKEALAAARSGRLSLVFKKHFPNRNVTQTKKPEEPKSKDDLRIDIPEDVDKDSNISIKKTLSSKNRIKTIP